MFCFGRTVNFKMLSFNKAVPKCLLNVGRLDNRGFLCLKGIKTADFLQGLVTNNMNSISQPNSYMYSFLLNPKGRILTDAYIYHSAPSLFQESEFFIESDKAYLDQLFNHLTCYNLRKKVKISIDDSLHLWIAMPTDCEPKPLNDSKAWLPVHQSNDNDKQRLIFYASDPRGIPGWSGRILIRGNQNANNIFLACKAEPLDMIRYHCLRWKMGLPEGLNELISGETLPLDANGDLSGAVNFSKGCYIGQELTARSHFTGVIRRRYIPIKLKLMGSNISLDQILINNLYNGPIYQLNQANQFVSSKSRPVGWIRGLCHVHNKDENSLEGLALLRLTEAGQDEMKLVTPFKIDHNTNDGSGIVIPQKDGDYLQIIPFIPSWWPEEISSTIKRIVSY